MFMCALVRPHRHGRLSWYIRWMWVFCSTSTKVFRRFLSPCGRHDEPIGIAVIAIAQVTHLAWCPRFQASPEIKRSRIHPGASQLWGRCSPWIGGRSRHVSLRCVRSASAIHAARGLSWRVTTAADRCALLSAGSWVPPCNAFRHPRQVKDARVL
jgi:hypothetical protein